MNEPFEPGDVLSTIRNGTARYIRISPNGPNPEHHDYVYVQDCDAAGFLLNGRGRYLQTGTIRNRYRLHHRNERHYT